MIFDVFTVISACAILTAISVFMIAIASISIARSLRNLESQTPATATSSSSPVIDFNKWDYVVELCLNKNCWTREEYSLLERFALVAEGFSGNIDRTDRDMSIHSIHFSTAEKAERFVKIVQDIFPNDEEMLVIRKY